MATSQLPWGRSAGSVFKHALICKRIVRDGLVRLRGTDRGFTGPVNLGDPDEFTILELADRVIRLTKSKSRIKFRPLPQDDPKQRQPDISLARKQLKWKPAVRLEDGLKETIRYFKKTLDKA